MIYIGICFLLILVNAFRNKAIYVYTFLILYLFSSFRFEVGCDWTGYLNEYNIYSKISLEEAFSNREFLWKSLFILQNVIGLPYPWINVISGSIFFSGIHIIAKRQPSPLSYLVLLFPVLIINMPMSGIRQAAAIGMMGWAFAAFIDRRLVRYILFTLAAAALHSSAIVFLLLAPLVNGRFGWPRLIASAFLAIPGGFALQSGDAAITATGRYIDTGIDAQGAAFRLGLLFITAVIYFVVLRRQWMEKFPQDYNLVSIGALMMIAVLAVIPISTVIGDRLGYYLVPIQTIILSRLPYLGFNMNDRLLRIAPSVGLFVVLAVWATFSWHFQTCYLPYQTWLTGIPLGTRY